MGEQARATELVKTYVDENRRRIVRYACGCGLRITHISERSAEGDPQIAVERSECPLHSAAPRLLAFVEAAVTTCVKCDGHGRVRSILSGPLRNSPERVVVCSACAAARQLVDEVKGDVRERFGDVANGRDER